jgi:hypothetical protein
MVDEHETTDVMIILASAPPRRGPTKQAKKDIGALSQRSGGIEVGTGRELESVPHVQKRLK